MSLTFLPWLSLWTAKPPAHTHTFNGPFSGTTRVSQYQKGKTNLDFTEARESEWQWHQLGHMQVCTSLQTDNHASTPPLKFFTGQMPFLPPNQQRQSTEGKSTEGSSYNKNTYRRLDGQRMSACMHTQTDEPRLSVPDRHSQFVLKLKFWG